jgi:hypothetical protein
MASTLRIRVSDPSDAFAKAMREKYKPVAKAAKRAMTQVADNIKAQGRADIMAGGLTKRWANTFRVDVYPKGSAVSVNAAALVYHKIPYADIFETGGTIHGAPKLWLPLSSTPKKLGTKRMTPEIYIKEIGPLFPINRAGKAPLLAGYTSVSAKTKNTGKITSAKLRRGAAGGARKAVPLFVGVDQVSIEKKFHLRAITAADAAKLASFYFRNFLDE